MKNTFFLGFALLFSFALNAQKSVLPPPINSILYNETDPILNGKGNTLIFRSESSQEPAPYWSISYGSGSSWSTPVNVDALNFSNKTLKNISPSLNFEGNRLFFSSNRYGGIGSGDIWTVNRSGNTWASKATNLGMPINSKEYESDPYLAPDEKTLYFVRYNTNKTTDGLPCGDIYTSTYSGKAWATPQKLPQPINSGCECNPQMLNDNKTLIFASQRAGGKGSYDLYISVLDENNKWSKPKPVDFLNSKGDDRGVSIPAQGNMAYKSVDGKSSKDIQREIVADEFQPAKTLVLTPTVYGASQDNPVSTKLMIKNLTTGISREFILLKDRSNTIFLHKPYSYELVYLDPSNKYIHHTEYIDLSELKSFEYKSNNIILKNDIASWQIELPALFGPDKSINTSYIDELKRINAVAEANGAHVEISLSAKDTVGLDSTANEVMVENLNLILKNHELLFADQGGESDLKNKVAILRFRR